MSGACHSQNPVKRAPVSFIIAADYKITAKKYGDRAKRYVHFEIGHVAQNILLEATALGLSSVPIGACQDSMVSKFKVT